jgi:hypothetical protein
LTMSFRRVKTPMACSFANGGEPNDLLGGYRGRSQNFGDGERTACQFTNES